MRNDPRLLIDVRELRRRRSRAHLTLRGVVALCVITGACLAAAVLALIDRVLS